ncbi:hypothetical protein NE237_003742 [Protea cynaroides]|uniref:Uncharacterized protein n=1 Tax=Protea cynaroides TaxID=273540 RepID=A0A9Q0KHD6_9MAGN|nr:hypothetical protein NE237_003742 [Protea cynaroides]
MGIPPYETVGHSALTAQKYGSSPAETIDLTKGPEKEAHAGDLVFESTQVARALVEQSRLPLDIKHMAWSDREAIQRCYWYEKMRHLSSVENGKLQAPGDQHQVPRTQGGLQSTSTCHGEDGSRVYGSPQNLSIAQDKAKGAEGELTREKEKLHRVEDELHRNDLKFVEERVQSTTSKAADAKKSLQRLKQREKLY